MSVASLVAALIGAAVSVALFFRAGGSRSLLLVFIFMLWILAPFVALIWANLASKQWLQTTRATLYIVTVVISLFSVLYYSGAIPPPARSPRAVPFVMTPIVSWGIAVFVPLAALMARKR